MRWTKRCAISAGPYAAESSHRPSPHPPMPPLLKFLEEYPGLFVEEVIGRLDPADRAVLAQVAHPLLAAVEAAAAAAEGGSGLPRAGKSAGVPLKLAAFVGSEKRLAWAKSNGCPWTERTCAVIAAVGQCRLIVSEPKLKARLVSAQTYIVMNRFQALLSISTCAATPWAGIWRCWSGRGKTAARGMSSRLL